MTDHDPYQRLMHDFGEQLDAAIGRRERPPRRRRRVLSGLALAGIGAAVLLLAGNRGGAHFDVVAQARDALSPAGQIVHLVTTMHVGGPPQSEPLAPPATSEQWATGAPLRWRISTTIPDPSKSPDRISGRHGLIVGPVQYSYANGTDEYYAQRLNTLDVTTGLANKAPTALGPGILGSDPVLQARAMLNAGLLHDAGTAVIGGKKVRRLAGAQPRPHGLPAWPVVYDVNPDTFAPVRVTIETRFGTHPPPGSRGWPTLVFDVNQYSRLPLNAQTAKLLTIHPIGAPTVYQHPKHPTTRP